MTAAQWTVLDNLFQGWDYCTNLDRGMADEALRYCESMKYVADGKITDLGKVALRYSSKYRKESKDATD